MARRHSTDHLAPSPEAHPPARSAAPAHAPRAAQAALARGGLPRSRFHDLRHAAATFLLAQGFTLEDVKNLLGHSSITLQPSPSHLEVAADDASG